MAAPGPDGRCPLAAALSRPARCATDRLREWAADGTTDASSRESQTVLECIRGVSRSLQAIETGVAEAGGAVAAVDGRRSSRPCGQPLAPSWWCRPLTRRGRWCSRRPWHRQGGWARAETPDTAGRRRAQPLSHGLLSTYHTRGGRSPTTRGRPPGEPSTTSAGGHSPACAPGGAGGRGDALGATGRPARRAPPAAAGGPHRWG